MEARLLEVVGEDAAGQVRYRLHNLLRVLAREKTREEDTICPPSALALGRVTT